MAGVTNEQLILDYLEDEALRGDTKKTLENYGSCIKIYKEWLHSKKLNFLSVDDMNDKGIIEGFLRYLRNERTNGYNEPLSFARIKVIFSALNSFYGFLEYKGYVKKNIVLTVRKRYLKQYKNGYVPAQRKIIDVDEMSKLLNSIMNLRDRTIVMLFVKTGVRRGELILMDVDDVDLVEGKITLKKRELKKRSNPVVFFDDEMANLLSQWFKRRKYIAKLGENALFVGDFGGRLQRHGISDAVTKWATRMGIHDPASKKLEDHFTCHSLRHCFTTYLSRNGMPREYVKELRGDARGDVIDIYNHIDPEDLRRSYLATMPKFNVF